MASQELRSRIDKMLLDLDEFAHGLYRNMGLPLFSESHCEVMQGIVIEFLATIANDLAPETIRTEGSK